MASLSPIFTRASKARSSTCERKRPSRETRPKSWVCPFGHSGEAPERNSGTIQGEGVTSAEAAPCQRDGSHNASESAFPQVVALHGSHADAACRCVCIEF